MRVSRLVKIFVTFGFICPIPVFAAFPAFTPVTFEGLVILLLNIVRSLVPFIAALSIIVFFWGIAKFILSAGDERARTEGKKFILWGIISLFVMMSIWGIISIFTRTIGVPLFIPSLPERIF